MVITLHRIIMLIQFPSLFTNNLQQLVLTLNTVLIIAALVAVELTYAEADSSIRKRPAYLYPIFTVLGSLLIWAVYLQIGKG